MQISDDVQILIRANATPIKNELTQLGAELDKLKENQKQFTRGSKDYAEAAKEIEQMKQKIQETAKAMDVTGMSVKQLTEEQRRLTKEFNEFGTGGERLHEVNTRLAEVKGSVRAVGTEVNQSQGMWSNLKGWIMGAFSVAAIIEGTRAIISFGKEVFEVGAKFEKYEAVLKNTFGSQEKATKAMSDLQKQAAKTPFTLDELTASYIKYVNRGIEPSMESMTKLGDLAASQGKSFDQLTEAVLDAGMGEFTRLKEFSIGAKKMGDDVELSFKGVHKTVKLTPEAVQGAIESFGAMNGVAGTMAETMKTGEGQASNFNDKMDALKVMLYKELSPAFKGAIGYGSQMVDGFMSLVEWTKSLWYANQPLVEVIKSLFRTMGNVVDIVWDTVKALTGASSASETTQKFLNYLKIAFGLVAGAAATLVGIVGLVIDGLRFLSREISFSELQKNASRNFSEIGKSLKATFVDNPKGLQAAAEKEARDLEEKVAKGHSEVLKKHLTEREIQELNAARAREKKKNEKIKELMDAGLTQAEATAAASDEKISKTKIKTAKKAHEDLLKQAEKTAEDELEIRKKLADATDKVWFDSIDDQWEKKRLAIIREYEKDWETQKNLVGDSKELKEKFAEYEIQLAKNRDAALAKLAAEKQTADEKILADKQKDWEADLAKMEKEIDEFNKNDEAKKKEILKADKDKAKEMAEYRKEMFQSLLGLVNDSFNDTIQTLENIDSAYAQSQANRIKAIQGGFQQIASSIGSMKIDTTKLFTFDKNDTDGIAAQLGDNIAEGLGNAFTANPIKFLAAGKKIIDGINGIFEANRWAKFEAPLRKIIDDSIAAIEDMGRTLEIKMEALRAEGDKLLAENDSTRDQLTAAALDYEAEQLGILVKSKEDLKAVNEAYSAEELHIKQLYAAQLNSTDAETAAKAREIVAGLIHDLQISRNEDIENLIYTENTKRDINIAADNEIAELNRTAADRTLTEQQALIAAVEANRQADLAKLKDYEGQKAEINRLADEALLAAKNNANNLTIAEQQRLVDEIEAKRQLDLGNLATSELGIEAIKNKTAAELKAISENAAAETFRIESELKVKQKQAEWQHNAEVYQAQLAAWQAEQKLTIGLLQLQLIKANGKIFNKSEAKAIEAALAQAYGAMPPMPPAGFFNYPSGDGGGAATSGGETKLENGGFVGNQFFNNGGVAQGPRHRQGGIWMWNPQTRQKVGELEGGEYIVNRRATAAHLGLISQINNSALTGRVRNSSFSRIGQPAYEDGGVFSTFGPITLNQSNSKADETLSVLEAIMKATGATAKATEITANNTDATAKNTNALVEPARESANNSRNLGSIASATRDTANKNFSPQISIINQQLELFRNIENSARL